MISIKLRRFLLALAPLFILSILIRSTMFLLLLLLLCEAHTAMDRGRTEYERSAREAPDASSAPSSAATSADAVAVGLALSCNTGQSQDYTANLIPVQARAHLSK